MIFYISIIPVLVDWQTLDLWVELCPLFSDLHLWLFCFKIFDDILDVFPGLWMPRIIPRSECPVGICFVFVCVILSIRSDWSYTIREWLEIIPVYFSFPFLDFESHVDEFLMWGGVHIIFYEVKCGTWPSLLFEKNPAVLWPFRRSRFYQIYILSQCRRSGCRHTDCRVSLSRGSTDRTGFCLLLWWRLFSWDYFLEKTESTNSRCSFDFGNIWSGDHHPTTIKNLFSLLWYVMEDSEIVL